MCEKNAKIHPQPRVFGPVGRVIAHSMLYTREPQQLIIRHTLGNNVRAAESDGFIFSRVTDLLVTPLAEPAVAAGTEKKTLR